MHGKRQKKKSKRVTLNKKYKIERKVRQHTKKIRRDKKRHPEKYAKKKSDPGVPNSCPFKTQLIYEAQKGKEFEEQRRNKINMELKMRRKEDRANMFNAGRNISEVVENTEKRVAHFKLMSQNEEENNENQHEMLDKSMKGYRREFKKVVEAADVILEVLDARDPQGTRCLLMEDMVKNCPEKRLVLIINKVDLIPKINLEKWLKYLRRFYPTLPFKASTQSQMDNLGQVKSNLLKNDILSTSKCLGANLLIELLKNYSRNKYLKRSISVGVVGMPNVGKSSLINSLKRSRACNVGSKPGVTKVTQEVCLDSKLRLIDCPGIILPKRSVDNDFSLRNVIHVNEIKDPISSIGALVNRVGVEQLMLHYQLPQFDDATQFLALHASRTGRLAKGGRPNIEEAARIVLHDWNTGKIKYYTNPPSDVTISTDTVLAEYSKEFDFDDVISKEESVLDSLPVVRPSAALCMEGLQPVVSAEELDNIDDDIISEYSLDLGRGEDAQVTGGERKLPRPPSKAEDRELSTNRNITLKKLQKKVCKKLRKEKNRNETRDENLLTAFENFPSLDP